MNICIIQGVATFIWPVEPFMTGIKILIYKNLFCRDCTKERDTSRGVTSQSSVLPPATVVKHKVKGQEAKIVKVNGQA